MAETEPDLLYKIKVLQVIIIIVICQIYSNLKRAVRLMNQLIDATMLGVLCCLVDG